MDRTSRRILACLVEDARMKVAEIARRVGLTAPTVTERLRQLESSGVIRGYRVELDPRGTGLPIEAFVRLRIRDGKDYGYVAASLARHEAVLEAHRITGDDGWLLRVAVRDVEHLEQTVNILAGYGVPSTSVVLSTAVPLRPAPLPTAQLVVRRHP